MADKNSLFLVKGAAVAISFTGSTTLTGWTLAFYLKDDYGGTTLVTKTTSSGIAIDGTTGYTVTLTSTNTNQTPGLYYHETWRTDSGSEDLLAYGPVLIEAK